MVDRNVYKVSDVNKYIKACFDGEPNLRNITVQGEISNFKRNYTGHCYFSLKEGNSVLQCAMFRGSAAGLKFQPQNGMKVLAAGSISVYEVAGVYQLYVNRMIPDGIGELALAFEQLRHRLAAEGLFDESHKKPIPRFSKLIGVVTSPTGAVIRDIYRVSKDRDPFSRIVLYPVQVQGEGSAEQIAEGIRFFNEKYPVDVIIVGRGGGSAEDLWCFNDETVVRSIYRSHIPIISAVGHETDFTLSDFAADRRAATPSNAAEIATQDIRAVAAYVQDLSWRLDKSARLCLDLKRQRLDHVMNSMALRFPSRLLEDKQMKLDIMVERLNASARKSLENRQQRLGRLMDKLEMMNPMKVLRRGYSMVQSADGRVVTDVGQVLTGDELKVSLSNGRVTAKVLEVERYGH